MIPARNSAQALAMKPSSSIQSARWIRVGLGVAFLALAAWMAFQQSGSSTANRQEKLPAQEPGAKTSPKAPPKTEKQKSDKEAAPKQANPLLMKGLTLKDQDGKVVYKGDIDLTKTLERIKKGERFPHRNDGAAFGNRERRLPQKPPGYYTEYVVPTPDVRGPGPQRLVMGEKGEVYYTADHYRSFKRVSVPLEMLPGGKNSENTPKKDE